MILIIIIKIMNKVKIKMMINRINPLIKPHGMDYLYHIPFSEFFWHLMKNYLEYLGL